MPNTNLDTFFLAYVTCALWSSDDGVEPLEVNYDDDDIAPETLKAMRKDCEEFLTANREAIGEHHSQAGHDFWLTRNGHGAGFWDRGDLYGSAIIGEELSEAARECGGFDLYVGDDKRIYA